jgi:hypothetical protein
MNTANAPDAATIAKVLVIMMRLLAGAAAPASLGRRFVRQASS